jgi:chromosome partitioning protein
MNWTSESVFKLFNMGKRYKTKRTLMMAEKNHDIPTANRVDRGSVKVRMWETQQLPEIGEKFGFLDKPKKQTIISTYTSKGGVLKTTLSHNLGRMLALNNIKTLIVGLDIQLSITDVLQADRKIESIDDLKYSQKGLFHYLNDECLINEIICNTDLPTLDFIPETSELSQLEKLLRHTTRKEYFFHDKLIPYLSDYGVIIFDNSPNWNCLIEDSITVSDVILSPIGCEINSYRALEQHLDSIDSYNNNMKINNQIILIPTLLEKTKLSMQIYGAYMNEHPNITLTSSIRRSIKGHEASLIGLSVIEHESSSPLAQDYFEISSQIMSIVNENN